MASVVFKVPPESLRVVNIYKQIETETILPCKLLVFCNERDIDPDSFNAINYS